MSHDATREITVLEDVRTDQGNLVRLEVMRLDKRTRIGLIALGAWGAYEWALTDLRHLQDHLPWRLHLESLSYGPIWHKPCSMELAADDDYTRADDCHVLAETGCHFITRSAGFFGELRVDPWMSAYLNEDWTWIKNALLQAWVLAFEQGGFEDMDKEESA